MSSSTRTTEERTKTSDKAELTTKATKYETTTTTTKSHTAHTSTTKFPSPTERVVTATAVTFIAASPTSSVSPSGFSLVRAVASSSASAPHTTHYLLGHPLPEPGVSFAPAADTVAADQRAHDRALGVAATAGLSLLGLALFFIGLFVVPALWRRRHMGLTPHGAKRMEDQVAGQRVSRWLAAEQAKGGRRTSSFMCEEKHAYTHDYVEKQGGYDGYYEDEDEKDDAVRYDRGGQQQEQQQLWSPLPPSYPHCPLSPPLSPMRTLPVLAYAHPQPVAILPSSPPRAITTNKRDSRRQTMLAYERPPSIPSFPFPKRTSSRMPHA